MDKKKAVVFIDTNIFVIDLRYKNDTKFTINRAFLDYVASGHCKCITSIYNLLEVCGILSFNLNEQQMRELYYFFPVKYKIDVMPSHGIDSFLPAVSVREIMDLMYGKTSLGDALIAGFVKKNVSADMVFVSWDADHFRHLLPIRAHTPEEFLKHLPP